MILEYVPDALTNGVAGGVIVNFVSQPFRKA